MNSIPNSRYIIPALCVAPILLPENWNINVYGWLLHRISKTFFENVFGGATEGLATGVAESIKDVGQNVVHELTKDFDAKKFGQKFSQLQQGFTEGVGYQQGSFGQILGETLAKEWETFATSSGADPAQSSAKLSELIQTLIKNLKIGKISETASDELGSAFDSFFDTFDVAEKSRRTGEEIRKSMEQSTFEIGKGLRVGLLNTAGEVLMGVTLDLLPYFLVGMAAVTSLPLAIYYVYRKAIYNIGSPRLATETHQRTILTPLTERVKSATSFIFNTKSKRPVFNEEITRRIDDLSAATQNIRKNGGYFQNVLFYGPGGTGKTMISEHIAKNSGMSYIKMSGGDLAQYIKRGEHVTELNKLLDKMNLFWRPWSTRPWILFIDEAESLCCDRSKVPTSELLELQNAFLNRTGTDSNKFMIILSTNRMEDLDEAVLSRMDHKIFIGPPAEPERIRILQTHVPHFFSKSEQAEFFKDHQVQELARSTDGLTGRALFKLLKAIANKKATTKENKLTQPIIDQKAKDMVEQEKEVEKRRALKKMNQPQTSTSKSMLAAPSLSKQAPSNAAQNHAPKTLSQRLAAVFS